MEKLEWENGLRILLLPEEDALSASVDVWVEAGSLYEDPAEQGISHFAEHMLFKGTEKRTARRISEEIDALGGSLNAYTTRQYTRFYAQVLSANPVSYTHLDVYKRQEYARPRSSRSLWNSREDAPPPTMKFSSIMAYRRS